jgi:hypothetical protein
LGLGHPAVPKGIPHCLKKRQMLNDQAVSLALCREYGKKFLALDWREDALEFFKKGDVADELENLKAYCLETGDAYLLARIGKQEPEVWGRLGERALALGKLYFARRAFEFAGDDDKCALVAGLIAGQTTAPGAATDEDTDS